ncbi:MAG: hypothetical protein WBY93_17410 [Candidatus Binatus sp.]
MLGSTVLDVAIGLIFTFLAISLAVSAIVEAIASAMKWRSSTLLQGIKNLLNDPNFDGLARSIYNHALVNPQDSGTAKTEKALKNPPAYMDPRLFADALVDVAKITQDSPDKIKLAIDTNVKDEQLNSLLKGFVNQTAGDLGKMRDEIAAWFDNSMDRVGGVYKRKTQLWSFAIALIVAAALNVSAVGVGEALWLRPMLARTIGPATGLNPAGALALLETLGFPIGWSDEAFKNLQTWNGLEMLAGWLITATATLFGAPFWFDMLEEFVRLKGSGPSPAEKRTGAGASS